MDSSAVYGSETVVTGDRGLFRAPHGCPRVARVPGRPGPRLTWDPGAGYARVLGSPGWLGGAGVPTGSLSETDRG